MDHSISMEGRETRATLNERLEALKARYVDNQQQFGDGDLNKIMDTRLYQAVRDVEIFIRALEKVSESRKLALSLIFDQVTPSGDSLLHVAASSEKDDVMELILNHFPSTMTGKNSSEDTPLHVAVRDGGLKATSMLIRLGIDSEIIYQKNKDGKSPLYLAVENCKPLDWEDRKGAAWKILQLLLEACAQDDAYEVKIQGMSPVLAALGEGKSGILKEIVDRLPKLLHLRDEVWGTPLHCAASAGDATAVGLLLSKGPDLALQTDKNGSYPIHIACQGSSYRAIFMLMLSTWPDLAAIKNNEGQNVLHVAAKGGYNLAVFTIILSCNLFYKADVVEKLANSKDVNGNTPLHLASMHNHCQVLLFLTRDKRSDLRLLNKCKLTALDVAMKSKSFSTEYPAFLGPAILGDAGVPQSEGRDIRSPQEHIKWMKGEVNTLLVVATLVASVTFAAGLTLPGGYNSSNDLHPGTAIMLDNIWFQVFVISNMLAMYSSILAVAVLLWGHVTEFHLAELAYYSAGPLLLAALTGMAAAFLAAATVAVSKLTWLASLVMSIAVSALMMLIMVLAALIFPSFRVIAIMTVIRIVPYYYGFVAQTGEVRRFVHKYKRDVISIYISNLPELIM